MVKGVFIMAKKYTKEEIAAKVKEVIGDYCPQIDLTTLKGDTTLGNVGEMDSMNILLIITKLEAFYGVEIPDRKWKRLQTFDDFVDAFYDEI